MSLGSRACQSLVLGFNAHQAVCYFADNVIRTDSGHLFLAASMQEGPTFRGHSRKTINEYVCVQEDVAPGWETRQRLNWHRLEFFLELQALCSSLPLVS